MAPPKLLNAFKAATVIAAFIGGIWLDRAVKFRDPEYARNDASDTTQDLIAGVHLDENAVVPPQPQEDVLHRDHEKEPDEADSTATPKGGLSSPQEAQHEDVVEAGREPHATLDADEKGISLDVDRGTIDETPDDDDEDEPAGHGHSTKSLWSGSQLGGLIAPSGGVLENARSVYAEVSAEILVRQLETTGIIIPQRVRSTTYFTEKYRVELDPRVGLYPEGKPSTFSASSAQ